MTGRQTATVRRDGSFDAFEMALRGLALSGSIEAAELSRVVDQLAEGRPRWRGRSPARPTRWAAPRLSSASTAR